MVNIITMVKKLEDGISTMKMLERRNRCINIAYDESVVEDNMIFMKKMEVVSKLETG